MRLVVYRVGELSWYWRVMSGTNAVCESSKQYQTKDAAKKAAAAFAKRIRCVVPEIVVEEA